MTAYYNEIDPYAAQWLRCASCGVDLPMDQFSADLSRPRGRKYSCKPCSASKAAARYKARLGQNTTESLVKLSRDRNLAKALVSGARKRSAAKSIAFDLAGACELTGLPFQAGKGHHWASPSIDRIDASGPYLYSNIRVVLHGYNNALGNWGEAVLFAMVDARRATK